MMKESRVRHSATPCSRADPSDVKDPEQNANGNWRISDGRSMKFRRNSIWTRHKTVWKGYNSLVDVDIYDVIISKVGSCQRSSPHLLGNESVDGREL